MTKLRNKKNFLTSLGYAPVNLDEIENFHQSTKSSKVSDYVSLGRIVEYLFTNRAKQETARNNRKFFSNKVLDLPDPVASTASYENVISARRSFRDFDEKQIDLQDVSNILSVAKTSYEYQDEDGLVSYFYKYPTPGGLHSSELYILLFEGGKAVLTHYNPVDHVLSILRDDLQNEVFWDALCTRGQDGIANASTVILITSIFERLAVKYGLLSYRLALMESGLLGHHIALGATAHDIKSLTWAGYLDDDLNKLLGCDGVTETVTNCILIGKG